MRVIVAGTPDWPDPATVYSALEVVAGEAARRGQWLTVVHGYCVEGAEHDADRWTKQAHSTGRHVERPERHPPQWHNPCRHTCPANHRRKNADGTSACPSAGFHRNDAMVDAGADFYLAFICGHHRGTEHLLKALARAGVVGQLFKP